MTALSLAGICIPPLPCPAQGIDLGGSLASAAAGSVIEVVGDGLQQAAGWLVAHVMDLIDTSTTPDTTAQWFIREMKLMEAVVLLVVVPVLMVATIGAVLRQDSRRLFRVWGVGLPLALFSGLAASQLAGWAVATTDALCAVVLGEHAQTLGRQFSAAMAGDAVAGSPEFVQIIMAGLVVLGAVAVWLELTVRSAGVFVATFFMPVALVAYIWPATAGVAKRAVEILLSLILSKFVIVSTLSLGLAAMAGSGADAAVSGAAVLLLAAFAPFALIRLAPVVEASAIAHLEGMSRRPARAAGRAATGAAGAVTHPITQMLMAARSAAGGGGPGGGDAGLVGRVVAAQGLPQRAPDYPVPQVPGGPAGSTGD